MQITEEELKALDEPDYHIGQLLAKKPNSTIEEIATKLITITIEELNNRTMNAIVQKNRLELWLFNREYTRRGVAPIFRNLENSAHRIEVRDLIWFDLEWLHAKYKKHKPFFSRWGNIFTSRDFSHSTAKFINDQLHSEMWRNVKGLALKPEWQIELNILKTNQYLTQWYKLQIEKAEVLNRLRANHHSRNLNLSAEDTKELMQRRLDIWVCAVLANRKPQPTANLYLSLTGKTLTRQNAAKIIKQVLRDIPEAFQKTTSLISE